MRTKETRVFRRPVYMWFPVVAGVVAWICAVLVVGLLGSAPVPAFVVAGFAVFFWAIGWDSAIRSTDCHVSFTNILLTTTVAWTDVRRVNIQGGLTVTLRDGSELNSIAFGGSLLGDLTGYRTHRPAFRQLRQIHRTAHASEPGGGRQGPVQRKVSFAWRRLLCALAVVYVPLVVALVL
ncbi:hypothetical protein [Streptomyces sp. MMBL 11-1]|uniref:hypothetical protein n=1 Tax=Streptomyces sp. MMBL 11-1 TaxID=3026420 RepID=UPI00235E02C6|nr:hypothetical protein [Streptomyces sp. MMBL 11-1]